MSQAIRIIEDEHRSLAAVLSGLCTVAQEVRAGRMTPDRPEFDPKWSVALPASGRCRGRKQTDAAAGRRPATGLPVGSSTPRRSYRRVQLAVNGNEVTTLPLPSTNVAVPSIDSSSRETLRVIGPTKCHRPRKLPLESQDIW